MTVARRVVWMMLFVFLAVGVASSIAARASEVPNNLTTLVDEAYGLAIPVLVAMDNFYRSNGRLPHNGDEDWLDALDEISDPRIGIGGIGTLMVSVTIDKAEFGFSQSDLDNLFIRFEPKKGNARLTWFCTSNLQYKAKYRPALKGMCKHGTEYPSQMNIKTPSSVSTPNTGSGSQVVNQGSTVKRNAPTTEPASMVVEKVSNATPRLVTAPDPVYPARALSRGIEGYVDVQFTILPDGTTANPVVTYSTSSLFERSAVRAVLDRRYASKGESTNGIEDRIIFEISQ